MKMLLKHIRPNNYRKPLIYCVSFLLVFFTDIAINIACGPETDPYDYYISFFNNNLTSTNQYKPFYFTRYPFLYDETEPEDERAVNSAEWAAYFNGQVKPIDVEKVMYSIKGPADSLLLTALPDSLAENSFLRALRQKRFSHALAYYNFAKKIEPHATTYNEWDPAPRDTAMMVKLGDEALRQGQLESDRFLKLRYFYQAQRILRYAGRADQARNIYTKYIANYNSASHIKGGALAIQAGMEQDSVRSAYLFSRVFEKYPERRVLAYRNYHYTHAKAEDILTLAKNDGEKATVYAIEGLMDPNYNIQYLKEIYGCDPKSPVIGVLLAREVNKLEEAFLDQKIHKDLRPIASPVFSGYYDPINTDVDTVVTNHIKALSKFSGQLFSDRKYPDYGLGKLISAYLAWMQGDTKSGLGALAELNNVKLSGKLNDQKHITNLLLIAQGIKSINETDEAALLPSLQWLDEKVKAEAGTKTDIANYSSWSYYAQRQFASAARNFYQTILAPAYYRQGLKSKAAAAIAKGESIAHDKQYPYVTSDFWQNYLYPASVAQLIAWKKDPPQNGYLKLLTKNLKYHTDDELYDLLGTSYLRVHNYSKAIKAFNRVSKKYLNGSITGYNGGQVDGGDPFIIGLADYPKVWLTSTSRVYNKLDFAIAMRSLQLKIKNSPGNPQNYYKYANALYNTGMHGNSWDFISYNWAAADAGRRKEHYYDDDYIESANAEKYYLKARSVSNDREFKAKCTFMAAKCQQKQFIKPGYGDYDGKTYDVAEKAYAIKVRQNQYFAQLSNYSQTQFYKQAVSECSYFSDFLGLPKTKK